MFLKFITGAGTPEPATDLSHLRKDSWTEQQIIDVATGELKSATGSGCLKSNAIGSCVVVTFYDRQLKTGIMAHIMLPGSAPEGDNSLRTRFAANAVEEALAVMKKVGAEQQALSLCMIGGGNVLMRPDDTICSANIASVEQLLAGYRLKLQAAATGGRVRRSARLDIETGSVFYTEDDSHESKLFEYEIDT